MRRVPYGERYWYDHMAVRDVPLWERFMRAVPDAFDSVAYDVPVGTVPEHAQGTIVDGGADMGRLYKRRIDVVGFKGGETHIIEVKPGATMSAIGQVLGYKHLYMRDEAWAKEPKAIVVTDAADDDMKAVAYAQGVSVIVV